VTGPIVQVADVVTNTTSPIAGIALLDTVTGPALESSTPATRVSSTGSGAAQSPTSAAPLGDAAPRVTAPALEAPGYLATPRSGNADLPANRTSRGTSNPGQLTLAQQHSESYAASTSVLSNGQARLSQSSSAPLRDDAPQAPSVPFSGSSAASAGGLNSGAVYGILFALGALALSQYARLQLKPARWRSAAFIALLERPG
jgi:hypothetical protein